MLLSEADKRSFALARQLKAAQSKIATLERLHGVRKPRPTATVRSIVRDIANAHEVSVDDVFGRSRLAYIVAARQEAYYVLRKLGHSLKRIGEFFGRDHTTIMDGIRAHEARVAKQSVSG